MNEEELMKKVKEYEFSKYEDVLNDPFDALCSLIHVRGDIRRLVLKDLLMENYMPTHRFFRYFISKTQGMPFLQILKRTGFLIEVGTNFYINPEWIEAGHTFKNYRQEDLPFFEKKEKVM